MTQKYQNKEYTHKTKMKQNRKHGVHFIDYVLLGMESAIEWD